MGQILCGGSVTPRNETDTTVRRLSSKIGHAKSSLRGSRNARVECILQELLEHVMKIIQSVKNQRQRIRMGRGKGQYLLCGRDVIPSFAVLGCHPEPHEGKGLGGRKSQA